MTSFSRTLPLFLMLAMASAGCSTIKYNALEKIGVHKRDLLVANVKDARDAQKDAQEEFRDALERFGSVVNIEETGLKKAYGRLQSEYDDSVEAADEVSEQISEVEEVANDLFDEWKEEIKQYSDETLRRDSEARLMETQVRYGDMLESMKQAESSMQPVLATLNDNVLYLKHNLNAQAVGSLQGTFQTLESDIGRLIEQMNRSIERSDEFIRQMQPA